MPVLAPMPKPCVAVGWAQCGAVLGLFLFQGFGMWLSAMHGHLWGCYRARTLGCSWVWCAGITGADPAPVLFECGWMQCVASLGLILCQGFLNVGVSGTVPMLGLFGCGWVQCEGISETVPMVGLWDVSRCGIWTLPRLFSCQRLGMWRVMKPIGSPELSCKEEGTGWLPAGSFVPTWLGARETLGESVVTLLLPHAPKHSWRPQPASFCGRRTRAAFSAAGAMVLRSIRLRQCRPFRGLQSGLDQTLHGCGPCAFQNLVNLYLDPNGGTRDEASSNNPWQEGQTGVGKDCCPRVGYLEEGM